MLKEIQKRPFVRPLFIWIAGIWIQESFDWQYHSFFLFLFIVAILLFSFYYVRTIPIISYKGRWVWGMLFSILLFILSIQVTAFSDKNDSFSESSLKEYISTIQKRIVDSYEQLDLEEEERNVLATITLGYRNNLSRETRSQFSLTGVAHILAVSGFHVGIISGFLSLFASFLPRNKWGRGVRFSILLIGVWVYILITGMAASSIRAGLMISFFLGGKFLRRITDSYNTLVAAAFCMLVYNPFYLFDIGFQLSYIAVFSILYVQPRLHNLLVVKNPLLGIPWSWLTVTLAAQMGVTFLCLYYFGYFSTVFLFTNLPLTGIATLLIPCTFLWLLLPVNCWVSGLLGNGIEVLTKGMVGVVDLFSTIPIVEIERDFNLLFLLLNYTWLILFLLYWKYKYPKILLSSLSFILILFIILIIENLIQ